ncbi:unnamed protein product [Didymodactylos carnosus]|uniref:Chaoptin n=1 Tax=Didymodactylos carnosus TaxID=1234261 RepID=A0A814ITL5_9BILA|nr:unnamed protein product [Didymodactylos carnosus]CAF3799070.1 unnamed protein product [Didymodactylos carnosus]
MKFHARQATNKTHRSGPHILAKIEANQMNCSIYDSAEEVVNSQPFYVHIYKGPLSSVTTVHYENKNPDKLWLIENRKEAIDIFCLTSLRSLTLSNSNIQFTPDIQYLKNLNELIIRNDNGRIGEYFPVEFDQLPLSHMNLSNLLSLKALPDGFGRKLEILMLSKIPNLEYLPENLFSLKSLFIEQCPKLTYLPSTIVAASNLRELTITRSGLLNIELNNFQEFSYVTFSSNPNLTLVSLINMNIHGNVDLSKNDQLSVVIIRNFTRLSLNINSLPSLQVLMLEDISSLLSLDLSKNPSLTDMTFNNIKDLLSLDMSQCQLFEFPMEILKFGSSLQQLDLSGNKLSSLPDIFSSMLSGLKRLYLSGNRLNNLAITTPLFHLEELKLNNNTLRSLSGIHKHTALRYLILDHNYIEEIPLEMIKLQELVTLSISNNRLRTIPYRITNLRKLTSINIKLNPYMSRDESLTIKAEFMLIRPSIRFDSDY